MYKLLTAFETIFEGRVYRHRSSTIGDVISSYVFDDLVLLGQSSKLSQRVRDAEVAVNTGNLVKGKKARRGDGTFGRVVPGQNLSFVEGSVVARGHVANLEIGAEVKVGATRLIAQVDRVVNDLSKQAHVFKNHNPNAIRLAIVGVNFADSYTSHEGDREFVARSPPSREASAFSSRIERFAGPHYDELLVLRFRATNTSPYRFEWVNKQETEQLYGSVLVRLSAQYERRF